MMVGGEPAIALFVRREQESDSLLGIVVGEESLTQFDAGARSPAVRVTLAPAAEAAPKVGRCENEGRQGKWTGRLANS